MSDTYGVQAVRAVLREARERARVLYTLRGRRDARMNEIIALAKDAGIRHQSMEAAWFRRRVGEGRHQGVLIECHEIELAGEAELWAQLDARTQPTPLLILVLDGVTDPRNFGACLRSANGAGVDAVIVPKRKTAPLSPVALKTAQGGAEDLFIVEVVNLARTLRGLAERGVWIVGAAGESELAYHEYDARGATALVMGGEGEGLRRLTREHCDTLVHIPMAGSVDSLNVSVATGVLLYEFARQRVPDGVQS